MCVESCRETESISSYKQLMSKGYLMCGMFVIKFWANFGCWGVLVTKWILTEIEVIGDDDSLWFGCINSWLRQKRILKLIWVALSISQLQIHPFSNLQWSNSAKIPLARHSQEQRMQLACHFFLMIQILWIVDSVPAPKLVETSSHQCLPPIFALHYVCVFHSRMDGYRVCVCVSVSIHSKNINI